MANKKVLVDSLVTRLAVEATSEEQVLRELQELIEAGHTLVCTEASSIDNAVFRHNVVWFESELRNKNIIIEVYQGNPGDTASGVFAMVNKKFEWSSYNGLVTEWSGTFEALAHTMDESAALIKLYKVVLKYALPKSAWTMGEWHTANYFSAEQLEELGVDAKNVGNRSVMFDVMRKHGYSNADYVDYSREYLMGMTSQHHCDDVALLEYLG